MDIEQLKMIIEALGAAGEGTKQLVLLYFGFLLAQLLVWGSVVAGAVWGAYRIVSRLASAAGFERDVMTALDIYSYLSKDDAHRAIRWMKIGKDTERGQSGQSYRP